MEPASGSRLLYTVYSSGFKVCYFQYTALDCYLQQTAREKQILNFYLLQTTMFYIVIFSRQLLVFKSLFLGDSNEFQISIFCKQQYVLICNYYQNFVVIYVDTCSRQQCVQIYIFCRQQSVLYCYLQQIAMCFKVDIYDIKQQVLQSDYI